MSAVTAGVGDIRKTIEKACSNRDYFGKSTILFTDEIHRFNKASRMRCCKVEDGTITLIAQITENHVEVISPLLSRCQVLKAKSLNNYSIYSKIVGA
ncbi:MAG: hypothetical protein R3C26_09770 [Calditrichia bacterium]